MKLIFHQEIISIYIMRYSKTREIVKNFGAKVLLIAIDSEIVKEILKRNKTFQKALDILGIMLDTGKTTFFLKEEKADRSVLLLCKFSQYSLWDIFISNDVEQAFQAICNGLT